MARGIFFLTLHPTGEPAAYGAICYFSEAALAAAHGIARACTNLGGGWVYVWDSAKLSAGPFAGVQYGEVNWFPASFPLIDESLTRAGGVAVGGVRDWFQDFVQRWGANWWRR